MALAVPPGGGPAHPDDSGPDARVRPRRPARPPAIDAPALSVVIVNYCQWRNTARLTKQLRRSAAARTGTAEVVIVDNHSPGHLVAAKLRRLRGVRVVRSAENQGFARAVNRGSRLGRGEWVLLLNPDVTVEDGFLDDVLAAADKMSSDPAVGVVGFQLRNRDGSRQASCGPFPTLLSTAAGLIRPRPRRKCRHQPLAGRRPVGWATGGCLLVRRACFDQLGGLDETFFLYYEDVDFCRRAGAARWGVWYEPGLTVTHHWPLHDRKVPAPLRLITRHALLTYAAKHWPGWQARVLGGLVRLEANARRLIASARADEVAAACYRELRELVGDVRRGRTADAGRRLRFAAGFLRPVAAAQDART